MMQIYIATNDQAGLGLVELLKSSSNDVCKAIGATAGVYQQRMSLLLQQKVQIEYQLSSYYTSKINFIVNQFSNKQSGTLKMENIHDQQDKRNKMRFGYNHNDNIDTITNSIAMTTMLEAATNEYFIDLSEIENLYQLRFDHLFKQKKQIIYHLQKNYKIRMNKLLKLFRLENDTMNTNNMNNYNMYTEQGTMKNSNCKISINKPGCYSLLSFSNKYDIDVFDKQGSIRIDTIGNNTNNKDQTNETEQNISNNETVEMNQVGQESTEFSIKNERQEQSSISSYSNSNSNSNLSLMSHEKCDDDCDEDESSISYDSSVDIDNNINTLKMHLNDTIYTNCNDDINNNCKYKVQFSLNICIPNINNGNIYTGSMNNSNSNDRETNDLYETRVVEKHLQQLESISSNSGSTDNDNADDKCPADCDTNVDSNSKNVYSMPKRAMEFISQENKYKKFIRAKQKYDKKSGKWYCKVCNKRLTSAQGIFDHIAVKHTTDEYTIYKCHLCTKKFKLKWELKRHIDLHDNRFQCKYCRKSFATNYILQQHIRLHKKGTRLYSCIKCNKKFQSQSKRDRHLVLCGKEKE